MLLQRIFYLQNKIQNPLWLNLGHDHLLFEMGGGWRGMGFFGGRVEFAVAIVITKSIYWYGNVTNKKMDMLFWTRNMLVKSFVKFWSVIFLKIVPTLFSFKTTGSLFYLSTFIEIIRFLFRVRENNMAQGNDSLP